MNTVDIDEVPPWPLNSMAASNDLFGIIKHYLRGKWIIAEWFSHDDLDIGGDMGHRNIGCFIAKIEDVFPLAHQGVVRRAHSRNDDDRLCPCRFKFVDGIARSRGGKAGS